MDSGIFTAVSSKSRICHEHKRCSTTICRISGWISGRISEYMKKKRMNVSLTDFTDEFWAKMRERAQTIAIQVS